MRLRGVEGFEVQALSLHGYKGRTEGRTGNWGSWAGFRDMGSGCRVLARSLRAALAKSSGKPRS